MKPSVFYKSIGVAASIAAASVLWSGHAVAMGPKIAAADQAAADQAAQEQQAQPVKRVPSSNPLSGDPEAIELGRQLYFTWCVQCHGHKANGESRFGKYAGDLTRFWRGYKEFVVIVQNGRTDKMMPPWKNVLDEDNISKLGAFLETLAVDGANWK
jgi:mono/diheme cytochrome c family protein